LLARYPTLPDVDNLVQECLVRVLRARETAPVESPKGLLFAIARNLALDAVRRQKVIAFEPMTENPDSSVFRDNTDVVETVSKQQEFALLTDGHPNAPRALPAGIYAAHGLRSFPKGDRRQTRHFRKHRGETDGQGHPPLHRCFSPACGLP